MKKENRIAFITMNRPEKRNAMSYDLVKELISTLKAAEEDPEIRVVILAGSGKGFSAGGDLETIHRLNDSASIMNYMKKALEVVQLIRNMDTYVIAAVQGFAAGAGFSIALSADFIVAEKNATFISSFSNIGLIPDLGLIKTLTDNVPSPLVKEWISSARPIPANELKDWGLVNRVVEGDVVKEAVSFSEFITEGPPLANRFVKQFVNHAENLNPETSDLYEISIQTLLLQSKDNKEGIAAFFEKRKPEFTGK